MRSRPSVKGFALTHLSTLEAMLEGGDAVLRAPKEKRSCKKEMLAISKEEERDCPPLITVQERV